MRLVKPNDLRCLWMAELNHGTARGTCSREFIAKASKKRCQIIESKIFRITQKPVEKFILRTHNITHINAVLIVYRGKQFYATKI